MLRLNSSVNSHILLVYYYKHQVTSAEQLSDRLSFILATLIVNRRAEFNRALSLESFQNLGYKSAIVKPFEFFFKLSAVYTSAVNNTQFHTEMSQCVTVNIAPLVNHEPCVNSLLVFILEILELLEPSLFQLILFTQILSATLNQTLAKWQMTIRTMTEDDHRILW